MAATNAEVGAAVKSCLCGSVQQSPGLVPRVRAAGHKCRICRTKPRFLRTQRSLDLGGEESGGTSHAGSPARVTAPAEPMRRRARSAERYDGMRVNTGEQPQPSLELYFGEYALYTACVFIYMHIMQNATFTRLLACHQPRSYLFCIR
jgi:hypothetical protein